MPDDVVVKLVLAGIFGGLLLLLKIFNLSNKKDKKNVDLKEAYHVIKAYQLTQKIPFEEFKKLLE